MERITKEQFDLIEKKAVTVSAKTELPEYIITDEDFEKSLVVLKSNPVEMQQQLAAKIKVFLDQRMAAEMRTGLGLTKDTRDWIKEFNIIVDNIQKTLYGEKKVNLHLHAGTVTHQHISQKMRQHRKDIVDTTATTVEENGTASDRPNM